MRDQISLKHCRKVYGGQSVAQSQDPGQYGVTNSAGPVDQRATTSSNLSPGSRDMADMKKDVQPTNDLLEQVKAEMGNQEKTGSEVHPPDHDGPKW